MARQATTRQDDPGVLRAAAAELRSWAARTDGRWVVDVAGPVASTSWLGPTHDVLTATWMQAAWVAMTGPSMGEPLAAMLELVAERWVYDLDVKHYPARRQFQDSALAVARALLADRAEVGHG